MEEGELPDVENADLPLLAAAEQPLPSPRVAQSCSATLVASEL